MATKTSRADSVSSRLFEVDVSDPDGVLFDRSSMAEAQTERVSRVMAALGALRAAEDQLSIASQRYMRLNRTDMRALHLLIVAGHAGEIVTPGSIAEHLGISTASTTKLLDRLERGAHIVRRRHPNDRRALAITVTAATRDAAMETVGRQQARRMIAASKLDPEELDLVARFLEDMVRDIDVSQAEWAGNHE